MRVIVEPKAAQEEDVFQPGKLVVSELEGTVMLVVEGKPVSVDRFCGVIVEHQLDNIYIGELQSDWLKHYFTKFVGKIILEQE